MSIAARPVALALAFVAMAVTPACVSTPLTQIPPKMPEAGEGVMKDAANAGRVQSIAVNPADRNNAIIAMQFGGMWKSYDAGKAWFRVYTLPEVYVTDVAYGINRNTVVATVYRDNKTQPGGGGGIYVSHTNGDFWTRPATGIVPQPTGQTVEPSAYSISPARDQRGLWYAGTDFGVAVSTDDGDTWSHVSLGTTPVQSVLAMDRGVVLAMDQNSVWRSDDRGAHWRMIITDDFSQQGPTFGNVGSSGNKMDRAPGRPWAFIFRSFQKSPTNGSGKVWFYEADTDTATALAIPQGNSRGPFFRVSADNLWAGNNVRVWLGTGNDGYYVIRDSAAAFRALRSTADWDDWVSFIAEAGIQSDMGDLGLDSINYPVLLGSDGGIYKVRPQVGWWQIGGAHKWMSAAAPGSGMNSLQISDLLGTNFRDSNGRFTTSLYFTTQDHNVYTSPDAGLTWRIGDYSEGFGLEGRSDAALGEGAQIAFIGTNASGDTFADANMTNKRPIPKVDENGVALTNLQNTYFVDQQPGAGESNWIRKRAPSEAQMEVYFSNNSGNNWRKFATLNFKSAGEIRTSGTVAWVPVFLGGPNNPVGLVPITTSTAPGFPPPTYDDSDAVPLPAGDSLGRMFTEWDRHAVYAVHPADWTFVIAPDITANDVKITHDGGKTWFTNAGLTAEVLRGGSLKMWGGKPDLMEVTHIAFDPYNPQRILVGTRDAGIVCSANGGRTWRTIYDSDKIQYITGFHFTPAGGVYISSYGQGLWELKASKDCTKTYSFPWDRPFRPGGIVEPGEVLARSAPLPAPRAIPAPGRAKLFVEVRDAEGKAPYLEIYGRGFAPGQEVVLTAPQIQRAATRVKSDAAGKLSAKVPLPQELLHGSFTLEARGAGGLLTQAEFYVPFADREEAKAVVR
jgi:hypothetical protein